MKSEGRGFTADPANPRGRCVAGRGQRRGQRALATGSRPVAGARLSSPIGPGCRQSDAPEDERRQPAYSPNCLPAETIGTGPHSCWRCLVRLSYLVGILGTVPALLLLTQHQARSSMYRHGDSDGVVSKRRRTSWFGARVSSGTESEHHANGDRRLPLWTYAGGPHRSCDR